MCQVDHGPEITLRSPAMVWRVQRQVAHSRILLPVWEHNFDGSKASCRLGNRKPSPWPINTMVKAKGYDEGLGFMAFVSKREAQKYTQSFFFFRPPIVIIPAEIPSGSRVQFGEILSDVIIGCGRPTLRTDQIILRP